MKSCLCSGLENSDICKIVSLRWLQNRSGDLLVAKQRQLLCSPPYQTNPNPAAKTGFGFFLRQEEGQLHFSVTLEASW